MTVVLSTSSLLQFSDILIHATISSAGGYKCRDVMPIEGMEVSIPQLSPVPFTFTVVSTTRSLTLAASTEEEKQEWYEVCSLTCTRGGGHIICVCVCSDYPQGYSGHKEQAQIFEEG